MSGRSTRISEATARQIDESLALSRAVGADQGGGDLDRIVVDAGQEIYRALNRRLESVAEGGNFRDSRRAAVEIPGRIVEDAFEDKSDGDPARRQSRVDAATRVNRQLE